MQYNRLKLTTVILFCISLTGLQAQETIPASGGNASGTGGIVSYSVGQIVYTDNTGSNGTVSPGVQQPYEISEVTGFKETEGIHLICVVYPNPVNDFLILNVDNFSTESLMYQLIDINGKLLESKKITDNETFICLDQFVAGTYFLKVIQNQDQKELKTFKIIKN